MISGDDICVLDITEETFLQKLSDIDNRIDETTDVITFNNVGIKLELENGENYWEVIKKSGSPFYMERQTA